MYFSLDRKTTNGLIKRWIAIAVAKKTGDYSVLSHADICVIALTYELDLSEKAEAEKSEVCFFVVICLAWLKDIRILRKRKIIYPL